MDGRNVYVNPGLAQLMGVTEAEALDRRWLEAVHPDDRERVLREIHAQLDSRDQGELVYRYVHPAGTVIWVRTSVAPLRNAAGVVTGFVGAVDDITESKLSEETVKAREAKLSAYLHSPAAGIVVTENGPTITEVNDAFCRMLGYARDEVLGKPVLAFSHPDDLASSEAVVRRIENQELDSFAWDKQYLKKDGTSVWTLASLTCIRHPDGRPWLVISIEQDITDRKRAEEALVTSEERYRLLVQMSPSAVVVHRRGIIEYVNDAGANLVGAGKAEDLVGRSLLDFVAAESKGEVVVRIGMVPPEGVVRRAELQITRLDGSLRTIETATASVPEARGGLVQSVLTDVTEVRQAQAQLAVASRLAAMGTLVAGVGHEINNPLTSIMAGLGSAMEDIRGSLEGLERGVIPAREALIAADHEELELLADAAEGAARIAQIVKELSIFGSASEARHRVQLADVVRSAMRWLPPTVPARASVTVESLEAPDVTVARGQIEQVVVNLITNAARATVPGTRGEILVRTGPGTPGMVRLEVTDRGAGMSAATLARLFTPFFTTRPSGEDRGTGLGLAICHAIVSGNGGTISVKSEVGEGSTFTVELPAAGQPGEPGTP